MISNVHLSALCDYADGRIGVSDLDTHSYISTENMLPNKEGICQSSGLPVIAQTQAYQPNDVLVSNIRPYFRKIWFADRIGGCSNDVLVMRAKQNCYPRFLYYILSDDKFFDYSTATGKGTKMPRGDKNAIMCYTVPDIPFEDQKKIANTLSALDDRITENKKINHHLPSPRSATDSSPDIRRGKSVSRSSARRTFSLQLLSIVSKIGCILSSNAFISFVAGAGTNSFSKSRVTMASKTAPFALRFIFSTTVSAR